MVQDKISKPSKGSKFVRIPYNWYCDMLTYDL